MGTFFQLSIECGADESLARSVVRHFEAHAFQISETLNSTCSSGIIKDADGNLWAIVSPSGLGAIGISSEHDAVHMTIAGQHVYERLLSSPPFRYAIAGVETEVFRTFSELQDTEASLYPRLHGLVMSHEIWESVGRPPGFVKFRDGYIWLPYKGETQPSR